MLRFLRHFLSHANQIYPVAIPLPVRLYPFPILTWPRLPPWLRRGLRH